MSGALLHARYFHVVYTQREVLLQDALQKTETGVTLRARRWVDYTRKREELPFGASQTPTLLAGGHRFPCTYLCCKGLKHLKVESQVYSAWKASCSSHSGWFTPDALPLTFCLGVSQIISSDLLSSGLEHT